MDIYIYTYIYITSNCLPLVKLINVQKSSNKSTSTRQLMLLRGCRTSEGGKFTTNDEPLEQKMKRKKWFNLPPFHPIYNWYICLVPGKNWVVGALGFKTSAKHVRCAFHVSRDLVRCQIFHGSGRWGAAVGVDEEKQFKEVNRGMYPDSPATTVGGGFKHFLFSPLLGEMIQFD